jgi:hypothetical protein
MNQDSISVVVIVGIAADVISTLYHQYLLAKLASDSFRYHEARKPSPYDQPVNFHAAILYLWPTTSNKTSSILRRRLVVIEADLMFRHCHPLVKQSYKRPVD